MTERGWGNFNSRKEVMKVGTTSNCCPRCLCRSIFPDEKNTFECGKCGYKWNITDCKVEVDKPFVRKWLADRLRLTKEEEKDKRKAKYAFN